MSDKEFDENKDSFDDEFDNEFMDESIEGDESEDFEDGSLSDDSDDFSLEDDFEDLEDDELEDDSLEEDFEEDSLLDDESEEDDEFEDDSDDDFEEDEDEDEDEDSEDEDEDSEVEDTEDEDSEEEDEDPEEEDSEEEDEAASPDEKKNKIILASLGAVFVGALGFVGYNLVSVFNPPAPSTQPQQNMSGLSGDSSIGSMDFESNSGQASGSSDDLSGLMALSNEKEKSPEQPREQNSQEVEKDIAQNPSSSLDSNTNAGSSSGVKKSSGGQPTLDLGLGNSGQSARSQADAISKVERTPNNQEAIRTGLDDQSNIPAEIASPELTSSTDVSPDYSEIKGEVEDLRKNVNEIKESQLTSEDIKGLMSDVISEAGLATKGYVEGEVSRIKVSGGVDPKSLNLDGKYLTKSEMDEILTMELKGIMDNQSKSIGALSNELKAISGEISTLKGQIEKMKATETQSPEEKKSERKQEKSYSMSDLYGRTRLPGFKIIGTEDNGRVALTSAPSGEVFKFFKGERILLKGKGVFTVQAVLNDGKVFLVGNDYFIDTTFVPLEKKENRKPKTEKKAVDNAVETKKDYIIAPSNPSGESRSRHSSASVYEQKQRSGLQIAPEGWSFNGGRVDQSQYLIKRPNGRWGIVNKGDSTDIGIVKGLNQRGDLIIGNYVLLSK